jgi:hypothetical protein
MMSLDKRPFEGLLARQGDRAVEGQARKPSFSGRYRAMQVPPSGQRLPVPKLGELLIGAELISDRTFYECLMQAQQSSQPVGKIIVGCHYASDRDVDSALLIQSLISSDKLKPQVGIEILKEAARQRVAVLDLLITLGSVHSEVHVEDNYIGNFLSECKLITSEQLGQAIAISQEFDVQLVRVLLHNGALSVALASKVLEALARVKGGRLDYQIAVAAVQYAGKTGATLQDALTACGVKQNSEACRMLLGEIIGRAGIASEIEILTAVETALTKGRKLGQALIAAGAIQPLTLQNALDLQDLMGKGVIDPERALLILRRLVMEQRALAEFANATGVFREEPELHREILNLLYCSRVVTGPEIVAAFKEKNEYGMDSTRALLATGKLPLRCFELAKNVYFMIKDQNLAQDIGTMALKVACITGVNVHDAIKAVQPRKPVTESEAAEVSVATKKSIETEACPPVAPSRPSACKSAAPVRTPAESQKWWQKVKGKLPRKF